jgi:hypothetical protein
MTATAAQILQIRRMVNEPDLMGSYSDALIQTFIEKYPLLDELGEEPYDWIGVPPVATVNADWIATYDLNAAAADIWSEKAAAVAALYDFSADGGNYSRSQMYKMYQEQARYYRSRRSMKTIRMIQTPEEPVTPENYIGNVNNPYE